MTVNVTSVGDDGNAFTQNTLYHSVRILSLSVMTFVPTTPPPPNILIQKVF